MATPASTTPLPFPTADTAPIAEAAVPPIAEASATGTAADGPVPRNELLDRVVQGAHEAIDRLADQAAPKLQRLQEGVTNTGDMLSKQADSVRETGDEWAENLRGTVREHPLAALATAIALGVLLARLTS